MHGETIKKKIHIEFEFWHLLFLSSGCPCHYQIHCWQFKQVLKLIGILHI